MGAAVADNMSNIVYMAEVTLRKNISDKMKQRARFRRSYRSRKNIIVKQDGSIVETPLNQASSALPWSTRNTAIDTGGKSHNSSHYLNVVGFLVETL